MEAAGLWVAIVAACAAIAGAVFAYVQAKAATDSLEDARSARDDAQQARDEAVRLAREANAAFVRQAEAHEEANRLQAEAMRPDDWEVGQVGESRWRVSNSSGRVLLVSEFDVKPDATVQLLRIETSHLDGRYEYGDSFTFMVMQVWGPSPEKLTIRYRYESDAEDEFRSYHLTLV